MKAKFIYESLEGYLTPKSNEDIIKNLSKLSNKELDEKLLTAAGNGQTDICKMLIDAGANINAKHPDNWTALHSAVLHGHTDVVKILLNDRADVNAMSKRGRKPLHLALKYKYKDIVDLLKSRGAIE